MTHKYENQINNILDQLESFRISPLNRAWLENDLIKFYVRKGNHYVENELRKFLDIANITIKDTSQGTYTELLKQIRKRYAFDIFVESIMEKRFMEFHLKNGFKLQKQDINVDFPCNVYLIK